METYLKFRKFKVCINWNRLKVKQLTIIKRDLNVILTR